MLLREALMLPARIAPRSGIAQRLLANRLLANRLLANRLLANPRRQSHPRHLRPEPGSGSAPRIWASNPGGGMSLWVRNPCSARPVRR